MFIRYNSTLKFWEYDTSAAQNGTGPWILLPVDPTKLIGGGSPTGHHATHETGGADALVTLDGSVIKTGTVVDARLSANVPLKNAGNVFTVSQTIQVQDGGLTIIDPSRPVDNRRFQIVNSGGFQYIQAVNDAVSVSQGYLRIARDGSLLSTGVINSTSGYYERSRVIPVGEWQSYTPAWKIYTAADASIGNGSLVGRYTLVGRTVFYTIKLSIGSTSNLGTSYWAFTLPLPPQGTDISGAASIRQASGGMVAAMIVPGAYYFGIPNSIGIISQQLSGGGGTSFLLASYPFAWVPNDQLWLNGFYET